MNRVLLPVVVLFLSTIWPLAGQTTAADKIIAGREALIAHDLVTAKARFSEALVLEPTNPQAAALLGFARVFAITRLEGTTTFLNRLGMGAQGRDVYHWTADVAQDSWGDTVLPSGYNLSEGAEYWRDTVLPETERARNELALVADPKFVVSVTAGEAGGHAWTADYGDVVLCRSLLLFSDFLAHGALSNDLHFNLETANQILSLDVPALHRLLSENPEFLKPSATAGDQRAKAKAALIEAIALYRQASAIIRARTPGLTRLFMLETKDFANEEKVRTNLDLVERAITGYVSLTDNGQPIVGTLAPVFSADFSGRALLPTLAVDGFGAYSVPDKTFGGTVFGLSREAVLWGFNKVGARPNLGWETLNPTPSTSRMNSYAFTTGAHVMVGTGGVIRYSADGVNWQTQAHPEIGAISAVVYGASGFVAVGSKAILHSSNGLVWRKVSSPPDILTDVVYGNGTYVAVGYSSTVMYSADGRTWRWASSYPYQGTMDTWKGIAFGGGHFIAVGSGPNRIIGSTDGANWTARLNSGSQLTDVACGNGVVVAVGVSGTTVVSSDGYNWTTSTLVPVPGASYVINSICFAQNQFLLVGTTSTYSADPILYASTDGSVWTQKGSVAGHDIRSMSSASDGFWLFGSSGGLIKTADGLSFTTDSGSTSSPLVPYGRSFYAIRQLRGKLWAVGGNGMVLTSSDGITFSSVNTGAAATLYDITDYNGVLYVVGAGGTVLASADGASWTVKTSGSTSTLTRLFVANGKLWAGGAGVILMSADGTTFQSVTAAGGAMINSIAYGNGLYVAVGGGVTGSIQTSTDGLNWTADSTIPMRIYRDVTFIDGAFWVAGSDGQLLRSPTGANWTRVEIGAKTHLSGVRKLGGRYVVTAYSLSDYYEDEACSSVFVSDDGKNWAQCWLPFNWAINAAEYFQNRLYISGTVATLMRSSVLPALAAPTIDRAPVAATVKEGNAVRLSVGASGDGTLTYEWSKNGTAIANSNVAQLDLGAAVASMSGSYTVTVRNSAGQVTSSAVVLTVDTNAGVPTITKQPVGVQVAPSQSIVLAVEASGSPVPTFQWYKAGTAISGATKATLSIAAAAFTDSGSYFVRVSNSAGSIDSQSVAVQVNPVTTVYWQTHDSASDDGVSFPQRTVHDGQGRLLIPSFNGFIDMIGDKTVGPLVRVSETTGTADLGFSIGAVFAQTSYVVTQPDGSILVAGRTVRGYSVAKFSSSGVLDTAFSAKTPVFDRGIRFITLQADGKILLTIVDAIASNPPSGTVITNTPCIYRLNTDGSVDGTFQTVALNNLVYAPPCIDGAGRIYLAGTFTSVNGTARKHLARLLATGALDSFADPSTLPAGFYSAMARGVGIQSDGKVVFVGGFRHSGKVYGTDYIGAIRFLADGTFDTTYAQPLVAGDMKIGTDGGQGVRPRAMVMLPNDQVVIVSDRILRLLANGGIDTTFMGQMFDRETFWVSRGADGRLFVPGPMTFGERDVNGLAVFLANGLPDYSFETPTWGQLALTESIVPQDSGNVWVGGSFNRMGTLPVPGIVMLDSQGQPTPTQATDSSLGVVSKRPTGHLEPAAAGAAYLLWSDPQAGVRFMRMLSTGVADPSFQLQLSSIPALAQPDNWLSIHAATNGRVYLKSDLYTCSFVGASPTSALVRILPDGTKDGAFTFGLTNLVQATRSSLSSPATAVSMGEFVVAQVLSDGRLLLLVAQPDGTIRVVRLLANGSVDPLFTSPSLGATRSTLLYSVSVFDAVANTTITQLPVTSHYLDNYKAAVQALDGKVYVGGSIKLPGETTIRSLIRLNADGSIDSSFSSAPTYAKDPLVPAEVSALTIDGSGRVYAAGRFDTWQGGAVNGLVRLTGAGALDSQWVSGMKVIDYPGTYVGLVVSGTKLYAVGSIAGVSETFPSRHRVFDIGTASYAPVITTQPTAQTTTVGSTVTLSVESAAIPTPSYQWYLNGTAITGATNAVYTISKVEATHGGTYTVTVTNSAGVATSTGVVLTVNPAPALERGLMNLSLRGQVGVGVQTIRGSFTVEGNVSKSVLIRGVGPALSVFGVSGVLANPFLTVTDSTGTVVATNDDWGTAANATQVSSVGASVGAFSLPPGSLDAAVLATFAPGTYHVQLSGVNQGTGVALFELYDAEAGSRMPYLSVRPTVTSTSGAAFAGFSVSGTGTKKFLIRAVANDLWGQGAMPNPALSVYKNGTLIASNDDWTTSPEIVAATATAGLAPLMGNNGDSVLLVDLDAGSYVAQVPGSSGSNGFVLIEVAEIDAQRSTSVAPAIVSQPLPMTLTTVQSAYFGVRAVGVPEPTYQWYRNGTAISGATMRSMIISAPQASDAGDYTVRVTNTQGSVLSEAAKLTLPQATTGYHSADTSKDWKIGVSELTRVIQLYNTRNGTTRTGAYAVSSGTADGFGPDAVRLSTDVVTLAAYHSADTNQDGKLGVSELTRVIQLYNTRVGTTRTGDYHARRDGEAASVDGFAPGT